MKNTHYHANLTPLTFLERCGRYLSDRVAISSREGDVDFGTLLKRARRMTALLRNLGVAYGHRVGLLTHNSPQSIEAHFAIPAAGGVIVSFNPWLPSADIKKQMLYSGTRVVLASAALLQQHRELFTELSGHIVVLLDAASAPGDIDSKFRCFDIEQHKYDSLVPLDRYLRSEHDPIAINFTSGTTGNPKGVVYSHRAAYLHAMGQILMMNLTAASVYYWSLPMFHVNGWGHMWATVAAGAQQVVEQNVAQATPASLRQGIAAYKITHMAGSPRLVRQLGDETFAPSMLQGLTVLTGGAAPPPDLVDGMQRLGVELIHQYGLNETLGPFVMCEARGEWDALPREQQTRLRMRQGIAAIHAGTGLRVVDQDMRDVPWDGATLGEVLMAGNTVALGYYDNPRATESAFRDGWFHSGDMAVVHPDGYLEIKDRMKDLIHVETPYGWENISSLEIENVASQFPGIKDVAVIGMEDEQQKPTIILVYEKAAHAQIDEAAILDHCRKHLPDFKVPAHAMEANIPKTATGKVVKGALRDEVTKRRTAELGVA
ncbi:acyl-CoA synthetase [Dyella sp. M7H15-1]|uniref:AMP-binding protein n=1 Tax=Dyella sp. M7H15-1 TaxID=2501295 RepID=UPI0010051590|nr:AMP-binding protein [Dyella sp. M7H15-1]QAU23004.1 acyl-CoA synthetase [Dyella sp. M7H15-1]